MDSHNVDRMPMDRGKRKNAEGRQCGNVLFKDPRKPALRFGHDQESSHASVTASTKHRIKKHLITAVQRHVVQQALNGVNADLSKLGGLGFAAPKDKFAPPGGGKPRRHPRPASVCSSQSLGTERSSIRAPPPPSEQLDPERGEWADVIRCNQSESEHSLHLSVPSTLRSSKVREILGRCEELKAEITSERRAASEANRAIEKHARHLDVLSNSRGGQGQKQSNPTTSKRAFVNTAKNSLIPPATPAQQYPSGGTGGGRHSVAAAAAADVQAPHEPLKELEALARDNPAVRRSVKKAYEKLEACFRNEEGLPKLEVATNPFHRIAPGYNARRHYKRKYRGELRDHDILNASALPETTTPKVT